MHNGRKYANVITFHSGGRKEGGGGGGGVVPRVSSNVIYFVNRNYMQINNLHLTR